jgi:hypothetical protein
VRGGSPIEQGLPQRGPEVRDPGRLRRAGYSGAGDRRRVNGDCVRLLARLRETCGEYEERAYLAGMLGPKGESYKPEEAPGTDEATAYHRALAGPGGRTVPSSGTGLTGTEPGIDGDRPNRRARSAHRVTVECAGSNHAGVRIFRAAYSLGDSGFPGGFSTPMEGAF